MRYLFLLTLFFASHVHACPPGTPVGYEKLESGKDRAYKDANGSAVMVIQCGLQVKPEELAKALVLLGEVRVARKGLSYVDVKPGALRIYSTMGEKPVQVSLVAKTPEALEKAGRDVVTFLARE